MILRQIDDIVHEENRIEFLFQKFGIRRPDPERNDGPRIPENRISDLLVDLGHILIRQHEIEVVFPGFGKDIGERFRREVLKLIDVQVEIRTFFLGHIHPTHGGQLNLRDHHRSEQGTIILADTTLGKVHDQDFPVVHRLAHIERRNRLTDDVPDQGARKELSDLVLDRRDDLLQDAIIPFGKLIHPEALHDRIGHLLHDSFPIRFIDQDTGDSEQRGSRILEKGHDGIPENVLQSGTP